MHRWEYITYCDQAPPVMHQDLLIMHERTGDHVPVLVEALLEAARTWVGSQTLTIIDGTVGEGGHLAALVGACQPREAFGLDRDPLAVSRASDRLQDYDNVHIRHHGFDLVPQLVRRSLASGAMAFVLLDLGLGSHQLASSGRGFSFRADSEPLDLRFDPQEGQAAWQWLGSADFREVKAVLRRYGELPRAHTLARQLLQAATQGAKSVAEFVDALPAPARRPETLAKLFQALRIHVNQELERIQELLDGLEEVIVQGSVAIAIISFHSLEDRIIKKTFRRWQSDCECPPKTPICICLKQSLGQQIPTRGIVADSQERLQNPRSRSARLRLFVSRDLLAVGEDTCQH